jgi:hypothetical protein
VNLAGRLISQQPFSISLGMTPLPGWRYAPNFCFIICDPPISCTQVQGRKTLNMPFAKIADAKKHGRGGVFALQGAFLSSSGGPTAAIQTSIALGPIFLCRNSPAGNGLCQHYKSLFRSIM